VNTLAATRDSLTQRVRQLEELRAEDDRRSQEARAHTHALETQCDELERARADADAQRLTLDRELTNARAEIEALRQQSADRGALAHRTNELSGTVDALTQQLAEQHAEVVKLERQRSALEAESRRIRTQSENLAAAAEREQAELRRARDGLYAEQRQQAAEADRLRAQVAELQAALDALRTARAREVQAGEDGAQRLAETQQRIEDLSALLEQRNAVVESTTAERQRYQEAARAAHATAAELTLERDELRRQLEEIRERLETEQLRHTEEQAALARDFALKLEQRTPAADQPGGDQSGADGEKPPLYQGPLVIERSAPLAAAVDETSEGAPAVAESVIVTPPRSHKPIVPSGDLVLLDEGSLRDDACAALQGAGFEVLPIAPTDSGVEELARRRVKCVMLNLGRGPAAWHLLRTLRERVGTRNVPILAYVMTKEASAGFCFGRADFVLWPMEPARIVERLGRLRPKLRRLLALSADVDGMGQLREPLAKAKVSTSIVLDGKQALEFAAMIEPEAAILHLSPACPSATRAVVGLRATEATRGLPLLLLLDKAAAPREDMFFTAANVQLLNKAPFHFTNLPEEIARVIA
jgi:hypothetical protein